MPRVIRFSRTPASPSDELWGIEVAAGLVTLAGEEKPGFPLPLLPRREEML